METVLPEHTPFDPDEVTKFLMCKMHVKLLQLITFVALLAQTLFVGD